MLSLASRAHWRAIVGERVPPVASCVQCCVSAVLVYCCCTVCWWCKCVRTFSDALPSHALRVPTLWWPCMLNLDPMTIFLQLSPHTDTAHSKFGTYLATTPSVCLPTSLGSSVPWGLFPECLMNGSRASLDKPANLFSTQWAATIPSPKGFELSLGMAIPFQACPSLLCSATLEFTLRFYSHFPVIAC